MTNLKPVVGVPREVKTHEGRVGLTPLCVEKLTKFGAEVVVEQDAGLLAGYSNEEYLRAHALLVASSESVWERADIIVKVKEPIPEEYRHLSANPRKVLFTYLHLAGVDPKLTRALMEHCWTAIAYETVERVVGGNRTFPLLVPMSDIAGREAMRGALRHHPNAGHVVIIGCGHVGEAALHEAMLAGVPEITVFESYIPRAEEIKKKYAHRSGLLVLSAMDVNSDVGRKIVCRSDIVICGPMLPGGKEAPMTLTARKHFRFMTPGAYIADVSIDQGGSTEWTLGNPTKPGETFTRGKRKLVFSAVPNIPGSTVPEEATKALTQATFPYVMDLVQSMTGGKGSEFSALLRSTELRSGLMTWQGKLYNRAVAEKLGMTSEKEYRDINLLFQ